MNNAPTTTTEIEAAIREAVKSPVFATILAIELSTKLGQSERLPGNLIAKGHDGLATEIRDSIVRLAEAMREE